MSGNDHFSRLAGGYRRFRPRYPDDLFDWLARRAPARGLAWDCAAGSGQATGALAARFRRVVASDLSLAQLREAPALAGVHPVAALAEAVPLRDAALDLVVVAQALHWFDLARFYAELNRVARRGALVAAWCYDLLRIDREIDRRLDRFYREVVGPFWPPERRLLESGYRTLPFPFVEEPSPEFAMVADWTFGELLGYLRTWSAVERCRAATGEDPVGPLAAELASLWGDAERPRRVNWPLALRVGRVD